MYRLLGALLVALTVAAPASAQTVLGIRGGVNFASLGGDDADGLDSRTAIHVGATVLFPLSEVLGLQVGGLYSQKGAEASEGGVTAAIELGYFEVPVLLRYAFPSEGAASFHLLAGPAVGFEVGCSISGSSGSGSASIDCSDAELDTKSVDFGLTGGLGLDFQASEGLTITVDGLYNLGLANIADGGDAKNRVFMLQAGVGFPLGG